jgi:hypothetical protein
MRSAPEVPYIVWILVSTVGLLQGLASHYRLLGLSFFRRDPRLGYVCSAILIPLSYYGFFSTSNRNVPGLEGWQLFSRFGVGALGGLILVLLLSSLVNPAASRQQVPPLTDGGIDDLQRETYAAVVLRLCSRLAVRLRDFLSGEQGHG